MTDMLPLGTFSAALGLILGFGFIIFVHELGHFVVAKAVGIKCLQFAIGMGHAIVSYRRGIGIRVGSTQGEYDRRLEEGEDPAHLGETEYRLCWLPIGGYVKMLGQDDMNPTAASEDPRSFTSKPVWARACVISAGVVMNLIFAVVFFVIAFMYGVRFPPAVVGGVERSMPAGLTFAQGHDGDEAYRGLQVGDVITHIDGEPTDGFMEVSTSTALAAPGETLALAVVREGENDLLRFTMLPEESPYTGLLALGIEPPVALETHPELKGGFVFNAGVKPGMAITKVDGEPVEGYGQVRRAVLAGKGLPVRVTFEGDEPGQVVAVDVRANPALDGPGPVANLLGFVPAVAIPGVAEDSPAEDAGIKPGDIVVSVDGVSWPTKEELYETIQSRQGQSMAIVLRRDDETVTVEDIRTGSDGKIGIEFQWHLNAPVVASVFPDGPGAALELAMGSRLTTLDGTPIADWFEFQRLLQSVAADVPPGEATAIRLGYELNVVDRPSGEQSVMLDADEVAALRAARWSDPLKSSLDILREPVVAANPADALAMGFERTHEFMLQVYVTLARLFQRTVKVSHLHGPVGIVDKGTQIARRGWTYLLFFLGLISVNLAVINFLPIPIVDGGLMVFLIVEKLKGSPVSPKIQTVATVIGLVLIASIFLTTLYFDITRLVGAG